MIETAGASPRPTIQLFLVSLGIDVMRADMESAPYVVEQTQICTPCNSFNGLVTKNLQTKTPRERFEPISWGIFLPKDYRE